MYKHGLSNYATFTNNPIIYADPNDLDSINVIRNMTSYTNHDGVEVPGSSSESMNIVKGDGKDVFTFTVSHKVYRQNGDLDRTETTRQTLDVNSYDYNSLYGHAYRIILDGMFTPERSMTGRETVGQWMNLDSDFAQYMIARNPESSYWQTGIKANLAYGGSGLGKAITWGAAGQLLSLGPVVTRGGGRAFWSGPGTETAALELGFETLEQTRAGQNLIKLTADMPYYPGSQAYNMWARLSVAYAKGASGTVHVFQTPMQQVGNSSIWRLYEFPTLMANPKVTKIIFHH